MMPLHDTRNVWLVPPLLLGLAGLAFAATPAAEDEEMLIAPPESCSRNGGENRWPNGEARLADHLRKLAELTCERFFVPKSLAGQKLVVDVGNEPLTPNELHLRVDGALRSKGIVLESAPATRVRRSSDPPRSSYSGNAVSAERLDQGIKCVERRCTLTREIVDAILADTNGLAASARIVPSFHDGKANGFKIYAIRPNSYLSRIGLQNGDTILSLDGLDLSSPDKALEAYSKLRAKKQMQLELLRRGQPVTMEYLVK